MTVTIVSNAAVQLGVARTHSEQWHAWRASGVSGSDVAAVLGLSPWESPFSLWHAKRNGWTGDDPTPQQEYGNRVESVVRQWWADDHGADVLPGDAVGTWASAARRWQVVNPDGLVVEWDDQQEAWRIVAGLECKTARYGDEWGTPGTDEIPVHYRTQVVWAMDVFGVDEWHVAVSIAGGAPDYYAVKYDPEEARLIRGQCAAFWHSLTHDQPPELDGHASTYRAVRRLHPEIDGTTVEIDPQTAHLFTSAHQHLKHAEEVWTKARALLGDRMGTAKYAACDGAEIALRKARGTGMPWVEATGRKSA